MTDIETRIEISLLFFFGEFQLKIDVENRMY